MAYLYINSRGEAWRKHSYSAGNDYDQCAFKYYLRRVLGWKPIDNKGSFKFGRALEDAIRFHHDNGGHGGVEQFINLWNPHKDDTTIKYTKTEKDWLSLAKAGIEMMRLYIIRQPSLPIPLGSNSVFQREYSKEVFPGDPNYGEIEDAGKLDIICYVDPAHPMLPKVIWKPEYGQLRPLIVDIKTSGIAFPEQPGMAAFDLQLRRYSWQSGIRDASLLWFVKKGHSYKKGSLITLLVDTPPFKAGDEVFIANVIKGESPIAQVVANESAFEVMEATQGKKENGDLDTTKAAMARKTEWLLANATSVPEGNFTRQRLQFNAGLITEDSANEAGNIAARQIVQIVNSWKNKSWPNTFGIRFPKDDRSDPYFRAFVLQEEEFKKDNFILKTEDAFDDLFAEDDIPEGEES